MGQSGNFYLHMDPVWSLLIVGTSCVSWVELSYKGDSARFSKVVSGYPTSTSIPRVDRLSMRHPGNGVSHLGIRVKVNDYLGSSVGVELRYTNT